ncbi:MAG: SUMF1/EgtB/PvdO family nonheme iron enzyme [Verrucomicrobia bacterium]|nr:SUMF1/EgtB/PvdO family nonheme iron enzyme [Verrucomicrobiota bacterium]
MTTHSSASLTVQFTRCACIAACLACGCGVEEKAGSPPVALPTIQTKSGSEMVLIPAGEFVMGHAGGKPDEVPAHTVRVEAFLMDRTEITQQQFAKLMRDNPSPSHFRGPDRPVEQVSWSEAALYCNLRSKDEGLQPCYDETTAKCNFAANGYHLPTEAEWEYACRAGTTTGYSFGADPRQLSQHGWFAENAGKTTQPVARKKPNAWGLFDMHGNVAEWCNDIYDASYYPKSPAANPRGPDDGERYVLRGGAWNSTAERCRSAARRYESPGFQDACFARDAIGFRCVRRPPATAAAQSEKPKAKN